MKEGPKTHLDADQIMVAMVDESDLDAAARQHLSGCRLCRMRQVDLTRRYTRLGNMARRLTPDSEQNMGMPDCRQTYRVKRRWGFKPVLGLAVAAVLVLMLVSNPIFKNKTVPPVQQPVVIDMASETAMMIDIDNLVDDVLPVAYQNIVEMPVMDWDEDFIQFIVPLPDSSDPASIFESQVKSRGKGALPC